MKKYSYATIIVLSFVLVACSSTNDKKVTNNNNTPISVSISKANETLPNNHTTVSGKIVSKNVVNISTRMMGYITNIHAALGQQVKAGQLLVNINAADIKAKDGQTDAMIQQAQANFDNAKKDYERFQNLFNNKSATQKELDDMKARYQMAKANVEAAQQMKSEVNAQYNYTNIVSPIAGIVTAKYAEQGSLANPGMPILTIESPTNLQVQALVAEEDITLVKEGITVVVFIKSINKTIKGNVAEISKSAVNTGGQYVVKINIPYSSDLLPGMFVNVQFPFKNNYITTSNNSINIMIPKTALVEQGQLTGVYVVSSQQTAVLRWIRIGKVVGDKVEVLSGLSAEETYIISSNEKLYNGAKVQTTN